MENKLPEGVLPSIILAYILLTWYPHPHIPVFIRDEECGLRGLLRTQGTFRLSPPAKKLVELC